MSTDMKSQNSEESDYSDQSDGMEDDDDDEYQDLHDYYNETDDLDLEKPKKCDDPEYFEYELLQMEDVDRLLNEEIEALCTPLKITPSLAKMLLLTHDWRREYILDRHQKDPAQLLVDSKIRSSKKYDEMMSGSSHVCRVCVCPSPRENFHALNCGHAFCADCWDMHFQVQIKQGVTIEGGYCTKSLSEGLALSLRALLGDPCPSIEKTHEPCLSVLYISLHRFESGCFYPYSGCGALNRVGYDEGTGFNVNIPWSRGVMGDGDYMAAFQQIVLPIAYERCGVYMQGDRRPQAILEESSVQDAPPISQHAGPA